MSQQIRSRTVLVRPLTSVHIRVRDFLKSNQGVAYSAPAIAASTGVQRGNISTILDRIAGQDSKLKEVTGLKRNQRWMYGRPLPAAPAPLAVPAEPPLPLTGLAPERIAGALERIAETLDKIVRDGIALR